MSVGFAEPGNVELVYHRIRLDQSASRLAQNNSWSYFETTMSSPKCPKCGAELLPEGRYCRRCGESVSADLVSSSSELPTAVLTPDSSAKTQRLESKVTSSNPVWSSSVAGSGKKGSLFLIATLLILVLGLITTVAYVRYRNHSRTISESALHYPGSETLVNMVSGNDRAIQLRTADSFDKVVAWYEARIKPTKTMRLTSSSIVLRNENVMVTIAAENSTTNILIKQTIQ
jgi:hypothetical protein